MWPVRREAGWGRIRWVGWVLLGCCVAQLVTGVVAGERPGLYDDLRLAVERGDVDAATVTGGMQGDYIGAVSVGVHWRDGLVRRFAHVLEVHPAPRYPRSADGTPRVFSVEEDLASLDRSVEVTREGRDSAGWSEVRGWRLPRWAGWLVLTLWVGTFVLIVAGPQPWRANRWTWFWALAIAAPVGIPAYLLLGGPSGLLPPVVGGRRIRGGVGLVLALVTTAALGAVATSVGL